eukprot:5505361-Prymnesium_polylepis.3
MDYYADPRARHKHHTEADYFIDNRSNMLLRFNSLFIAQNFMATEQLEEEKTAEEVYAFQ